MQWSPFVENEVHAFFFVFLRDLSNCYSEICLKKTYNISKLQASQHNQIVNQLFFNHQKDFNNCLILVVTPFMYHVLFS